MGTILQTNGGEWLSDHEGFVEYKLSEPFKLQSMLPGQPDTVFGPWTGLWAVGIEDLRIAVRAGCECGWRGPELPWPGGEPTEEQHDAYLAIWHTAHAGPIGDALDAAKETVDG